MMLLLFFCYLPGEYLHLFGKQHASRSDILASVTIVDHFKQVIIDVKQYGCVYE